MYHIIIHLPTWPCLSPSGDNLPRELAADLEDFTNTTFHIQNYYSNTIYIGFHNLSIISKLHPSSIAPESLFSWANKEIILVRPLT